MGFGTSVSRVGKRLAVLGLVVVVSGCGRGYDGDNRAIVDLLPSLPHVELTDSESYGYCSKDSCLFGNDRSAARLVYSIDTTEYTPETLIDAYGTALADWMSSVDMIGGCGRDDDPSLCNQVVSASFSRDDAVIGLLLDNWPVGMFELSVDAHHAG